MCLFPLLLWSLSDWDFVEPQTFSFSKKRVHSCTVAQKEMWSEAPHVKAPPISRRSTMPPTPLQNSNSSFGEEQRCLEVEDQVLHARDRVVIARTKTVPGSKSKTLRW